jgi:hypothetical protein
VRIAPSIVINANKIIHPSTLGLLKDELWFSAQCELSKWRAVLVSKLVTACKSSRHHCLAVVAPKSLLSRARKQAVKYGNFCNLALDLTPVVAIASFSRKSAGVRNSCTWI